MSDEYTAKAELLLRKMEAVKEAQLAVNTAGAELARIRESKDALVAELKKTVGQGIKSRLIRVDAASVLIDWRDKGVVDIRVFYGNGQEVKE